MKMRYLSHDYASKSYSTIIEQNFSNCINRTNTVHTRVRVTYYMIFCKHHLSNPQHHFIYYQKSYNLIINIITSNMPYQIFISIYFIAIFTDIIYCYSYVIHCNYIVTILITTLYSYIYRYILSIKIYDNQYRYKHIYSIIRMILNNTEMYIYTIYTQNNYTIINTILVYSNFFSVYHSYLL